MNPQEFAKLTDSARNVGLRDFRGTAENRCPKLSRR